MDIAEALNAKGYEIDRRKIVLKEAIKETGEYTVNVKLHREVTLAVPVKVTGENGEMPTKEEVAAAPAVAEEIAPAAEVVVAEAEETPVEEVATEEALAEDEAAA